MPFLFCLLSYQSALILVNNNITVSVNRFIWLEVNLLVKFIKQDKSCLVKFYVIILVVFDEFN